MKKIYLFFILPALMTISFFIVFFSIYLYKNSSGDIPLDQRHFMTFISLMSLFAILQIAYFTWKYMFKVGADINKVTQIATKFNEGSFAQRFSYEQTPSSELKKLNKVLNNLVAKIEKRMVNLQLQINEKTAVLSSMSEAVVAVNLDEKVYIFNKAAEKIFNTYHENYSDKNLSSLIKLPDLYKLLSKSIEQKKVIDQTFQIRDVFQGSKIKNIFFHVRSEPVLGRKDKITGMVFVIKDITNIKNLEKHRTNFVGNVSHELKTPLTLIQGFSETLLNNNDLTVEDSKKYIGIIHKHSSRLGTLINDLLAISKLENEIGGDLDFDYGEVNLLVKSAVGLCQENAKQKQIEILLEDNSNNFSMNINFSLFEQAIVNLVDNAIKYSDEKNKIEISMAHDDGFLNIDIKDFGCGMSQRHLDHIFERFYRVDKGRSRDAGGTGLGLSIVKHVVQLHGGSVSVVSEMDVGSTFTIKIPSRG